MTHAKFSTNGTTWTTATFTTTVSGNFVNFENTNYCWGALTDTGQMWKNNQRTDSLGVFDVSLSAPNEITQLSAFNNNFIGLSQSGLYQSSVLENWEKVAITWNTATSNFGGTTINSIAYGNGLWVAGGSSGQMRTSTNGSTWTTVTSNFGGTNINSIAYNNSLWVAGGSSGQMRTSTNGSTWTTVTSNFGTTQVFRAIRSIAYGNGLWVAGGYYGQMRISTNGSTWTTVTSNFKNDFEGDIFSIAYNNSLWVAGGNTGQIRTSTNGSTWTTVTSNFGNTQILSIAYGNSLWVAGGNTGQIRTSTNGSTWTTVTSNFGNTTIRSIAYGNGLWVAGGDTGQIRTSTNGSTWTTDTSNFGNTTIVSIAYGNGLWVAGGSVGQIHISKDLQLNLNKFIKSQNEEKAAFLSNEGILLNWNGTKYDSISTGINDNFVNGAIRNNGGTYEYIIQGNNAMYYSTNLTTWTTISVPTASDVNDIIGK